MSLVNEKVKERLLSILPSAMSKSKVASKKMLTAPPLRKVYIYCHSSNSVLVLTIFFFKGAIFSFYDNARRTRDSTISSGITTTIGGDQRRYHTGKMDVCRATGENQLCCGQNHTRWQGKIIKKFYSIYQENLLMKLG